MAQFLIDNGFPEGFQVLCWNCNCSRGHYGYCPCQREREQAASDPFALAHLSGLLFAA